MNAPAPARRDRLRAMLADLKMPGALEAVDGILSDADGGRRARLFHPARPGRRYENGRAPVYVAILRRPMVVRTLKPEPGGTA